MYWLFCLSGALCYFSHPYTLSALANAFCYGWCLHTVCRCGLLLLSTRSTHQHTLSGAAGAECVCAGMSASGLPLPPRARKSLRPVCQE